MHETLQQQNKINNFDKSIIRFYYFQKQIIVGTSFSLLSIGNKYTGKNIDIEFTSGMKIYRNYFDDVSFVIYLNTEILTNNPDGIAISKCVSGPIANAIALLMNRGLKIKKPSNVMNGLALYAHAISDKGLTPLTSEDEMY